VLGFTQLMQSEDERATPAQRQYRLGQIQTAGRSLLALVDDVLDLSEQAESLRDAVRTPMALAAALDQAVAAVSRAASARGVAFEFGDLSAVVAVDERRLQQLLLQLLGNAVKFSRPHGSVRLGSRIVGREAVLTIEDSGPGIDAERARRLFEAFESATGSDGNAAPSPGIGLAIGQALAQRMGARIELASTGPQGSLFELWLPLAETPAAPQPQPQPQQPPQQPPQPQPQPPASALAPTLLYIEDNDVNMLIVRELLAQRPRVVFLGAPDGHSGVRLARERLPSLVLIDMQLPDIDGIEVLRQLRADPRTASIPCVALSANAMREDVRSARAAGFDDYWTKPIDMPAFLRALDRLLPGAW
jgi:CheY-like chemotaxis protein